MASPAPTPPIRGVLPVGGGGGVYPVGDAGTVAVAEVDGVLRLVAAGAAPGWRSRVTSATGGDDGAAGVAVAFTRPAAADTSPTPRIDFRARSAGGVVVAAICPVGAPAALVVAGVQVATAACLIDA